MLVLQPHRSDRRATERHLAAPCAFGEHYYAYSPYGEVATLGPDEGNPLQYTGRENDGTGLYYYRARYYDPVLKRFVSEDPVGMTAGPNSYAYLISDKAQQAHAVSQ